MDSTNIVFVAYEETAESWFHTLKTELVNHRDYQTRRQAKSDIFEYIEAFYNHSRRHSALGYMTPVQYEMSNMAA